MELICFEVHSGPEFVPLMNRATTGRNWRAAFSGVVHRAADRTATHSTGKPTQNARIESFHGRRREECLAVSWFQNLFDTRPRPRRGGRTTTKGFRTAAWAIDADSVSCAGRKLQHSWTRGKAFRRHSLPLAPPVPA